MTTTAVRPRARFRGALAPVAMALLAAACVATASPSGSPAGSPSADAVSAGVSGMPSLPSEPIEPTDDAGNSGNGEFELPPPTCPSPAGAVVVPDVRVSIGDGPAVIAARGAATFSTCTMTSQSDVASGTPAGPWLTATHEDRIHLQVQRGWLIVRVQGYDHPAVGDGGNVDPAIDVTPGSDQVDVPVPFRGGPTMADWTLWLIRVDGRVVGQLDVAVMLHLPPAGG